MRDFSLGMGGRNAESISLMAETCSVRYVTASGNLSNVISLSMFASKFVQVALRVSDYLRAKKIGVLSVHYNTFK